MDINIDSKQLDGEIKNLESSVDNFIFRQRIQAPSQDVIKGEALDAYIEESSAMFDVMAEYLSLLTSDIEFVKTMAAELEKADSDYATQVNSNS